MGQHTGAPCFYCHQILEEQDDVVVCPDCGTPYHRACYQQAGRCINEALHASGGSWSQIALPKTVAPQDQSQLPRRCPNCGAACEADVTQCPNCGRALSGEPAEPEDPVFQDDPDTSREQRPSWRERMEYTAREMGLDDPYNAMDPEESLGDRRLGDMADFVAKNQFYYLPKFVRFAQENRRISLNIPCLFFPQLYFAYRKMLPLALILAGVFALLQIPQMAVTMLEGLPTMIAYFTPEDGGQAVSELSVGMVQMLETMQTRLESQRTLWANLSTISTYLDFCMSLVFGLLGNWFYYRHACSRVDRVDRAGLSAPVRRMRLRQEGGTNGWLILLVIGVEYLVAMGLTAVLMLLLWR